MNNILNNIKSKKGQIAVLIDPDKCNDPVQLDQTIEKSKFAGVDYFFVGGSTVSSVDFNFTLDYLKKNSSIPVVIFPGASHHVSEEADAILFLNLISGRNPDYLIGHHVQAAREIYDMDLEVIPTGYLLIDGGTNSSVAYVSQTRPIPPENESIILDTCKAGILNGKQILFLDAGSGANKTVPEKIIQQINKLDTPIIIGGGIRTREQIDSIAQAGANVIVVGNKIEEDLNFLLDIHNFKRKVNHG